MDKRTEQLLFRAMETIGRPSFSDYGAEDVGMLSDRMRRKIYEQLAAEAEDGAQHRLIVARLGSLCAQAVRPLLDPQDEPTRGLLTTLSKQVDAADLVGLEAAAEEALVLFKEADRCEDRGGHPVTLRDEPEQQAQLARATVTQAVKFATGGIGAEQVHRYHRKLAPGAWMPELWAACAIANGLPEFEHSASHKMRHFWSWYLTVAIPQALDLTHSTTEPNFTQPPLEASAALARYASPWAGRPLSHPDMSRRPFLHGYVEKQVTRKGRTKSMQFVHEGSRCGHLWVDYQGRRGGYVDDQYRGINYHSGWVEEVHLSHLASTQQEVPIDQWVAEMEAGLLQTVLSTRFLWFFDWADAHWEKPFQPQLHRDDLRVCMDSIEWTFAVSNLTVEEARPYHQIMWCFCAFALDEQVARAKALFHAAWQQDGELLHVAKGVIMAVAARH
ncbi:MAG: hypothetical protein CMP23_10365 [Rickettsiales bacterium]|nr:hypothetical protein [Rickettsiales bacterium]|tara:strand:- start:808 stop:2139 length:1332 start_codon:yes stop_codon:yes gene_type:complete